MAPKPATRAQLAYIASLYRTLGKPTPHVETRAGAYHAIAHAKRLLGSVPAPARPEPEPSASQLHDLAVLARRAGEPPPQPRTLGDAARELARLRGLPAAQPQT